MIPNFVNVDLTGSGDDLATLDVNARRPYWGEDGGIYVNSLNPATGKYDPTPVRAGTISANSLTLRKDEWIMLDRDILKISQERMRGIADLESRGLTVDLGEGLGTTILQWQTASDAGQAIMSMDGKSRGDNDKIVYDIASLPIPIISFDYEMNLRLLQSSRRMGTPMDTTHAVNAADKVARYAENLLFNGSGGFAFGGGTVWGYLTYDKAQTQALTYDWALAATTGAQIVSDVQTMLAKLSAINKHGPFVLYVPRTTEDRLDSDYVVGTQSQTVTVRQRLMQLSKISAIAGSDYLPAKKTVLVEMNPTTVRLATWNQGVRTFSWTQEGGWVYKFKVATIKVPNLRADFNGKTGICVGTMAGG